MSWWYWAESSSSITNQVIETSLCQVRPFLIFTLWTHPLQMREYPLQYAVTNRIKHTHFNYKNVNLSERFFFLEIPQWKSLFDRLYRRGLIFFLPLALAISLPYRPRPEPKLIVMLNFARPDRVACTVFTALVPKS